MAKERVKTPHMTVAQAREQARKYGQLTEFNRMYREHYDAETILFYLDVPMLLDGIEYRSGYGETDREDLLEIAKEYATGRGMRSGYRWLQDGFNEYFEKHEELVEKGKAASFGGATGSKFNREVLAGQIALELGNGVGGRHLLDGKELTKLKAGLAEVISSADLNNGLKLK